MTNVVAMPGYSVPRVQGEPIADVVEICEELLEMARSGKLRGIAAALLEADPQILTTTRYHCGPSPDRCCLIAAVAMLDHNIKTAAFRETD